MRLNLGAGAAPLENYDNTFDDHQGKEAFPLALPDGCADEVRASHLLEHFNHRGAHKVVADWMRVLKPGGLLKIAVPDLEEICRMHVAGEPGQYQGWLSGGQVDGRDIHLAQYDWHSLSALLRGSGLVGLHKWAGDGGDCSTLPISLNIAGWKRMPSYPKTIAVMSRPRLGFMDQFGCAMDALLPRGIPVYHRQGVYWGKCLTLAIEAALEDRAEWILTLDYDTLFRPEDIEDLMMLMSKGSAMVLGGPDALVPVQIHRMSDRLLMNPKEGTPGITQADMDQPYYPIRTGHFGCTLIHADIFSRLKKPWFYPTYKEDGEPQYDDDINFWLEFEKAGLKVFLTPRVTVGHLEAVVMWPDRKLKMLYQKTNDWREQGKPREVWR